MSIAEAMSLGVPVVGGQDSGAVPWVIGEGGVVADVKSAVAIEAALAQLLSDPANLLRHEQAAKARSSSFGVAEVAATYEAHYLTVLRQAGITYPIVDHAALQASGRS